MRRGFGRRCVGIFVIRNKMHNLCAQKVTVSPFLNRLRRNFVARLLFSLLSSVLLRIEFFIVINSRDKIRSQKKKKRRREITKKKKEGSGFTIVKLSQGVEEKNEVTTSWLE